MWVNRFNFLGNKLLWNDFWLILFWLQEMQEDGGKPVLAGILHSVGGTGCAEPCSPSAQGSSSWGRDICRYLGHPALSPMAALPSFSQCEADFNTDTRDGDSLLTSQRWYKLSWKFHLKSKLSPIFHKFSFFSISLSALRTCMHTPAQVLMWLNHQLPILLSWVFQQSWVFP